MQLKRFYQYQFISEKWYEIHILSLSQYNLYIALTKVNKEKTYDDSHTRNASCCYRHLFE